MSVSSSAFHSMVHRFTHKVPAYSPSPSPSASLPAKIRVKRRFRIWLKTFHFQPSSGWSHSWLSGPNSGKIIQNIFNFQKASVVFQKFILFSPLTRGHNPILWILKGSSSFADQIFNKAFSSENIFRISEAWVKSPPPLFFVITTPGDNSTCFLACDYRPRT